MSVCRTWISLPPPRIASWPFPSIYPLIFAVSRISGWAADVLEQYANNKLIRPLAEYTGPTDLKCVPMDQR
jgi:citrate synthase